MLSVQKIATLLYLSDINCMNIKGWIEVIAFSVEGMCCVTTLNFILNRQKYPLFHKGFPLRLLYLFISESHIIKMPTYKRSLFFLSKRFFVVYVPRGTRRINNR